MIKVTGPTRTGATQKTSKAKSAGAAFASSGAGPSAASSGASGAAPAATLSALIALQSETGADERGARGKTIIAAQHVLEQLEGLQRALLDGAAQQETIDALEAAARLRGHAGAAPELLQIYDEISLRARVELAKLGR